MKQYRIDNLVVAFNTLAKKDKNEFSYHVINFKNKNSTEAVERTYHTTYNNLEVDIKHYFSEDNSYYNFTFKQDNKNLFIVEFKPISYMSESHYLTNVQIDGIDVKDKSDMDRLLQQVDFNNFVIHETNTMNDKISKILHNDFLQQQSIADNFTQHFKQQYPTQPLNRASFIKDINNFSKSDSIHDLFHNIQTTEHNPRINHYLPKEYKSTFQDFDVTHTIKKDPDVIFKMNHDIHLSNKSQNIDLLINIKIHDLLPPYISIKNQDNKIENAQVVNSLLEKFNIHQYIEQNLKLVKHLEQARSLQTSIGKHSYFSQNNKNVENLNGIPITINNAKIWLNKNSELHRIDGPAIETAEKQQYYFTNGSPYIPEKQKLDIYKNTDLHIDSPNRKIPFITSLRNKFFKSSENNNKLDV